MDVRCRLPNRAARSLGDRSNSSATAARGPAAGPEGSGALQPSRAGSRDERNTAGEFGRSRCRVCCCNTTSCADDGWLVDIDRKVSLVRIVAE